MASTVDPNTTLVAASVRSSPLLRDDADVGSFNYLENAPAAAVAPNLEVADPDGLIASASITVTGWLNGQDALSFTPQGSITSNCDATNGNLSFTGAATPAVYQTLLRSVSYSNSSNAPNTGARTVNFQVNDGGSVDNLSNTYSRTVSVTAVNDAPVLGGTDIAALSYTENAAATAIVPNLTVADVDSSNLTGAMVSVTGWMNGQDSLTFGSAVGVTPTYNATLGTISFAGSASLVSYQTLLRSVS